MPSAAEAATFVGRRSARLEVVPFPVKSKTYDARGRGIPPFEKREGWGTRRFCPHSSVVNNDSMSREPCITRTTSIPLESGR
jgi:hypothetical protein